MGNIGKNAATPSGAGKNPPPVGNHYRELLTQTLIRQTVLYFLPLLLLAVFFHLQYRRIIRESDRAHLEVIAEHQANTLDLFLRERLVNLANVIDDPEFRLTEAGGGEFLEDTLGKLKQTSKAFNDLGTVNGKGDLTHYHGPVKFTDAVNYRQEPWFRQLISSDKQAVITDIYLGFRNEPHFTIAVKRELEDRATILRSA
ncbi:MAG: PDC sensor domain-containing protein, partial [Planctomycetota bacterium]